MYWADPSGTNSIEYNWGSGMYNVLGDNGNVLGIIDPGSFNLTEYLNNPDKYINRILYSMDANFDESGSDDGGGNGNGGGKNKGKYKSYSEWFQNELRHRFLNNFTFEDAIHHYSFGEGESVTVNLNSLNFDGVTVERFLNSKRRHQGHPSITVNFLGNDYKGDRKEQGLIYGNITLVYIGNNTIMALPDQYNFEMHKGNLMSKRNVLTFMGSLYNGYGIPYYINFQGTTKIKTK